MTPGDLELLTYQVEALFTHTADGRIWRINEPGGGPAPRFFFGRTREGNLWRVRGDVPDDIARRLAELAAQEPVSARLSAEPAQLHAFQRALGDRAGSRPAQSGPAYRFPPDLAPARGVIPITPANVHLVEQMGSGWEGFREELPAREPCRAVIDEGMVVSVCFSARRTARVAEAGVETLEAYRGREYARAVVSTWAEAVREGGRIPLYSTSWENRASQAVARALRLIQYGTDVSL